MKQVRVKELIFSIFKFIVCTWFVTVCLNLSAHNLLTDVLRVPFSIFLGSLISLLITLKTHEKKWANWLVYIGFPIFLFFLVTIIGDFYSYKKVFDMKLEKLNSCESSSDCTYILGPKSQRCFYLIHKDNEELASKIINEVNDEKNIECFDLDYASGFVCIKNKCFIGG